jgi:hypothetical protein
MQNAKVVEVKLRMGLLALLVNLIKLVGLFCLPYLEA